MNIERFGEFKTGSLEPIPAGREPDYAFVPNPLPVRWTVPAKLWPTIVRARDRIARLNGIGQTLPDPFLLLRPLQRREALKSSSLEGTYISPKELLLFELDKSRRAGKDDKALDWREVYNYYLALQKGRMRVRDGSKLTDELIKLLHKVLMSGTRGQDKNPGEFRDCQVHVGAGRRYNPAPPGKFLEECLANLSQYIAQPPDDLDELVRAFIVHYQFEAIHPFKDGNGRIGRLILSLLVFDWLDLSEPWLYLSEFFEKNRDDYIELLFRVSTDGDWEEWVRFCLDGTIQEAEAAIKRCGQLRELKDKYLKTAGRGSTRMYEIIDRLFSTPVVTVPEIMKHCKVAYPTAKSDVKKLVEADILSELENTYPQAYGAPGIMQIAFF